MLPKLSLLDELRKGGYEASLITTFNAYLPFYEDVVLRRLMNAGIRHNVLMMDAQQYATSLKNQPPRLAGRRYTLLPVSVAGAFHPKLIFAAGKHKGLVVIGSHNMTLSGFGFNRELTNVLRIHGADDAAGIAVARDVWTEVEHWLEIASERVPTQVIDMVLRVRDCAPWIHQEGAPDADTKVIAGRPGGKPLWQQLIDLTGRKTTDVLVGGAFFDDELKFLERIKQDLQPDRLVVGIDPTSVRIPLKVRTVSGLKLVHAGALGVDTPTQESGNRYLHAKAIFVRLQNGGSIFASGSANPSAPAWLATDTSGNVELMLVRRGESASIAAAELGFAALADMPVLSEGDWTAIQENQVTYTETEALNYTSGLAVVDDQHVLVQMKLLGRLGNPEFLLLNEMGQEISRSQSLKTEGPLGRIEFPREKLAGAVVLICLVLGKLALKLLLHHSRAIEEQARSGTQQRFKEALLSLNSDSPNFGLLLECLDKMLFSDERVTSSTLLRGAGSRDKAESLEELELGSLAIDISDTKKHKAKQRLTHTGDLAYLLDTLIYHLRYHEEKAIEELDRHGRSEEEQVDSDDEEDSPGARALAEEQGAILALCHAKVRIVITRMSAQLAALSLGTQSFSNVLVRLLGVLAVLRELRSCDGHVAWVEKGQTTVPEDERRRLLEKVMLTMFEGKTSLLQLGSLGEDFAQSDDVARLKGLVLWLACDCGLTMDLRRPFMEDLDERRKRLRQNAMALALAQVIRGDDVVIDEARQSIGSLTTGEMDWLKEIQRIATVCESLKVAREALRSAEGAEPGDIAVHRTVKNWDLRIVDNSDGARVSLIKLSSNHDGLITYKSEHVAVMQLSPGSSGGH